MNIKRKKNKFLNPKIVVNPDMKDHGNDPFIIKKVEASKKVIQKYGLPKKLVNGQK